MMTGHCDSIGYWREALFIPSATHGEIPCAANGWKTEGTISCLSLKLALGVSMPWHLLYFLPLPQGHGAFLPMISMVPLYMVLWFPAKFSQMPETLLAEFQLLEALPARALEVIVTGDCRVAALVADEPAVRPGYHLPKLFVQDAVRAPNYGRIHGDIYHSCLFRAIAFPPL
jgi:hypothetical protein